MGSQAGSVYWKWLHMPVRKQIPKAMPRALPTRLVVGRPRRDSSKCSGLGILASMSSTRGSLISSG